ncbi:MAG: DUF6049 family protein [Actinomycetota bacterium]
MACAAACGLSLSAPALASRAEGEATPAAARTVGVASPSPTPAGLAINALEIPPGLVGDSVYRMRLRVTNRSKRRATNIRLRFSLYSRTRSRSELRGGLRGRPGARADYQAAPVELADLAPGEDAEATLEVPASSMSEALTAGGEVGGVFPVRVSASAGGLPDQVLETALVYLPRPPDNPLRITTIWPFTEPPHQQPSGTFATDELVRLTASRGPLSAYAAALASSIAPLTLAPQARLLEELASMANGFTRQVGGKPQKVSSDDTRAQAAAALLGRLRQIAARQDVEVLPLAYAQGDLVALVRAGLLADESKQVEIGRDVIKSLLSATFLSEYFWPPEGALDVATLDVLAGSSGVRVPIVDARFLAGRRVEFSTPNSLTALSGSGTAVRTALVPDADLSSDLVSPSSDDPVVTVQRMLAETAGTFFELPYSSDVRGLLIAPSQRPVPGLVEPFLRGLVLAPWLKPQGLRAFVAEVHLAPSERLVYPPTAARNELPASYLGQVREARRRLTNYAEAVGSDAPTYRRFDRNLLVAESAQLYRNDHDLANAFLRSVTQELTAEYRKIRVSVSTRITLTARTGQIPVTLVNSSSTPVTVEAHLTSTRARPDPTTAGPFELPAHGAQTFRVSIETLTTGTIPLRVEVFTPGGGERITTSTLALRSTAYSRAAVIAVLGAAVFLVAYWGHRLLVRGSRGG